MTLQEIIRTYKLKTGASDAKIARLTGVARSTVTRWSNGHVKHISKETARKISDMVGYNVEPILKGMDTSIQLPLYQIPDNAADYLSNNTFLQNEVGSQRDIQEGDYLLRIHDNSMAGIGIRAGSNVLIKICKAVAAGDIAVLQCGEHIIVRKVEYKDQLLVLIAADPTIQPEVYSAKEVHRLPVKILGQVISCHTHY